MKKKIVLAVLFIVSLIPTLFNQYGGAKGIKVQLVCNIV